MKQYFYILLLSLLPVAASAQGENNNWYFGDNAGVNFASPSPAVLNNSQMFALEACGTVSDSMGNLLFYTNGSYLWNRQHQVMQNGDILGGSSSSQQVAIVKNPQNPNQYFLFTGGDNGYSIADAYYYTISYSIVDMSLGPLGTNGQPLGAVVPNFKKIQVLNNLGQPFLSEAISIVPASVDGTYWLLIPNGTKLYSYSINSLGFQNSAPVISDLNLPYSLGQWTYYSLRVSPRLSNGIYSHYLCLSVWLQGFMNKVYSFSNVTGKITNDYAMEINSLRAYLPEFNKEASVLFLGHKKIFAVDMLSSTPSNVNFMEIYDGSLSVPTQDDAIGIQRNKYNDIYISKGGRTYLGKIINPDVYGPAMSVDMNFVNLGSKIAYYGLPQLIHTGPEPEPQCIPDIVLTSPETHNNYVYQASNTVTTKIRYTEFPKQDITMKAGKYVMMLPNSYIMNGATYFATIEDCHPSGEHSSLARGAVREKISLFLDQDETTSSEDDIIVYPNPATSVATINTGRQKLAYWELYDVLGKLVLKGNGNIVKTAGFPAGTYMLRITTVQGAGSAKKLHIL